MFSNFDNSASTRHVCKYCYHLVDVLPVKCWRKDRVRNDDIRIETKIVDRRYKILKIKWKYAGHIKLGPHDAWYVFVVHHV